MTMMTMMPMMALFLYISLLAIPSQASSTLLRRRDDPAPEPRTWTTITSFSWNMTSENEGEGETEHDDDKGDNVNQEGREEEERTDWIALNPETQNQVQVTAAPTNAEANRDNDGFPLGPFSLKLHWTNRSCWNEDCKTEEHWCMQCEGLNCNWGDIVWVEVCRADRPIQQLFHWIPIPLSEIIAPAGALSVVSKQQQPQHQEPRQQIDIDSTIWGQLQMQSTEWMHNGDGSWEEVNVDLCMERNGTRRYYLEYCNVARRQQWFHGLTPHEPFELYAPPFITVSNQPPAARKDKCVKMHHHPRQYEEIMHDSCVDARTARTNMWQVVMQEDSVLPIDAEPFNAQDYYVLREARRDPRCRPEAQCGMCQGHCINSDDCAGSLGCYERSSQNPEETPPGCYGAGVPRTS
jgi:hypothetical protein